jgi:hypothetical protein
MMEIGKPHPWSELIEDHLYLVTLIDNLSRIPYVSTIAKAIFPSTLLVQNRNSEFSRRQVEKYIRDPPSNSPWIQLLTII